MYGMINIAIREMVIESYGQDTWKQVEKLAGLETGEFISMQTYPDALTYQLVGHLSRLLEIQASTLLEKIGEYWILHTASQGYGPILDMAGNNMVEFLRNLNTMHRGVAATMPDMVIPVFIVSDETPRSIILNYHSQRQGLQPMVIGLIKGLGLRYGLQCNIEMVENQPSTYTFQKYKISW